MICPPIAGILNVKMYRIWGLSLLFACMFGANTGYAQPVHPDVQLRQPLRTTATYGYNLRRAKGPQIGLLSSANVVALNPDYAATMEETIRKWEQFLIGHELAYRVLEDTSLTNTLPASMRLLILPSAEVLSEKQRGVIKDYMKRGGGVIASGRIGYLDDRDGIQNDRFFREVFGAEPSIDLPDTLQGLVQTVPGGHFITEGIPAGFMLNIDRPAYGFAALPITSTAIGHTEAYQPLEVRLIEQAISASTLMLYGDYEGGRFAWFGFGPQDVSLDVRQQAVYQALIVNAIAYATHTPVLSLRRWPFGYTSAASFAIMPSTAYRPYSFRASLDVIMAALERAEVSATGFFVSDQIADHPDVIERFSQFGELAQSANSPALLENQPLDLQYERVKNASYVLGRAQSRPIAGLYPPGGFFDGSTLRAALDNGIEYMLLNDRSLYSPSLIPWEDELDYRDSILTDVRHDPLSSAYSFEREDSLRSGSKHDLIAMYPTLYAYELAGTPIPDHGDQGRAWADRMKKSFMNIHRGEGLFMFAFDVESMGLSAQRAQALENTARFIHGENSWSASLGEIQDWWLAREDLSVRISTEASEAYEFVVVNAGAHSVGGVSINFWYNTTMQGGLELHAPGLDVTSTTLEDKIVLVIQSLPVGTHAIRLTPAGSEPLTMQ